MLAKLLFFICGFLVTLNSAYGKIVSGTYSDVNGLMGNDLGYGDGKEVNQNSPPIPVQSQINDNAGASYQTLRKLFNENSSFNNFQKRRRNNISKAESDPVLMIDTKDTTIFKTKAKKFILVPLQVVNGERKLIGKIKQFDEAKVDEQKTKELYNSIILNNTKHKDGANKNDMKDNPVKKSYLDSMALMDSGNFHFTKEDFELKPIDKSPIYVIPLFVEIYGNQNHKHDDEVNAIIRENLDEILEEHVKKQELVLTSLAINKKGDDLKNVKVVDNDVNLLRDMLKSAPDAQNMSNATLIRQKRIRRRNIK